MPNEQCRNEQCVWKQIYQIPEVVKVSLHSWPIVSVGATSCLQTALVNKSTNWIIVYSIESVNNSLMNCAICFIFQHCIYVCEILIDLLLPWLNFLIIKETRYWFKKCANFWYYKTADEFFDEISSSPEVNIVFKYSCNV